MPFQIATKIEVSVSLFTNDISWILGNQMPTANLSEKTLIIVLAGVLMLFTITTVNARATTGPGSFEILNGLSTPIKIPFEMHNGKPVMDVEINGNPAVLMIDNGILWDQVWLFGSPLIEKLATESGQSLEIGGAGEGDTTVARDGGTITLTFKDIIFREQPVLISPAVAGFADIFPGVDGQLCNTFFKHFVVEFDFINKVILLHDPKRFQPGTDSETLEMSLNASGTHSVPFSLVLANGEKFNDRVDIDFGGIYPLMIALNNGNDIQPPSDAEVVYSRGAQGRNTEYRGKIRSMRLGRFEFTNARVYFGDEKSSRIHPDNLGVIGLPMFMQFDTVFDYIGNRLMITPNENFNLSVWDDSESGG